MEGSCNHVAALLYALVDITAHKKAGLDASTSQLCRWNTPRKRKLSPKNASHFKRGTAGKADGTAGKAESPTSSTVNLLSFAKRLAEVNPNAGWLVNFSAPEEASGPKQIIATAAQPHFMYADSVDLNSSCCKAEFESFTTTQTVDISDVILLEKETKGQGKCELWWEARKGRLTASHFGEVCRRREGVQPDCLLKDILGYRPFSGTKHTKWGENHEAAARRLYSNIMKKAHPSLHVERAGLFVHPEMPFLAGSPDGLVRCVHCAPTQGLLEIKCPSVHRNVTPEEACTDPTFFCHLNNGQVTLKKNHIYFYQIQGQMAVTGRQWCDFFVWTLKGHSIERVHFDPNLWSDMARKLAQFYTNAMVPELFSTRVKRGKPLFPQCVKPKSL